MARKIIVVLISLVIASLALKIAVKGIYGESLHHRTTDGTIPDKESQKFVFRGIEVSLPWSRITGVYASNNVIIFAVGDKKTFFMIKQPTTHARYISRGSMRDKVASYFLGDLAELVSHPESVDRISVVRPDQVTWSSNPFSDVRTVIGLAAWHLLGGDPPLENVENAFMKGYRSHVRQARPKLEVEIYNLGMKDASGGITVMMREGTEEFIDAVLRSVRLAQVAPGFSRQAFAEAKRLARTSPRELKIQKLALFKAIEAASNAPPTLEKYTQVLDLYREAQVSGLANAWLGDAMHRFPAARSALAARYPEFAKAAPRK